MLDISNTACTPQWPNVRYIERRALVKFLSPHGVYLSRKPKQIHCGSHIKAWYSSGAMMSFMAVRVSILFMCRLDLWGSAEGVTDKTQYAIVWGWNVEPWWRRAQIRFLAANAEVWRVLISFVVADWHIHDSGGLVINRDPQFFTFIVKAASLAFYGRVWCYIISGELVYSA